MAAGRDALLEELAGAIRDRRVLEAVGTVPRDRFVPAAEQDRAWQNVPLPIAEGQYISQPLIVARMCELLELSGHETVLDVGTGSGYHAAVLARLARRVVSIERHGSLSAAAGENLRAAGIRNVELIVGDGSRGHADRAPYDAINVAAASRAGVPPALEEQLAVGGRLVLPAGSRAQRLVLVRRTEAGLARRELEPVQFVPLVERD